jgi:hypothetical protein
LFRKEYLPRVRPFPKVRELFQRIRDDHKRIVLASSGEKTDTEYYVKLLKIENLIEGYISGDDADSSKPAPDIFAASLKKLGDISPADAVGGRRHKVRHRSRRKSRPKNDCVSLRRNLGIGVAQSGCSRDLPRSL